MATFEEDFLYPLILLLVGAVVSGVLVAWLSNRWQNHRKELEVKVDIVSKMLEVYGSVAAKTFLSTMRREPISNIVEVLEKFCVDAYIVDSMLDSYYSSEADILDRWSKFFFGYVSFLNATSLYFVENRNEDEKRLLEDDLNKIKKYYCDNKEINWDRLTADKPYDDKLWREIDDLYWDRVSEIYKDVLSMTSRFSASRFSKWLFSFFLLSLSLPVIEMTHLTAAWTEHYILY